jgi:cell pole-organizing protein PopZ
MNAPNSHQQDERVAESKAYEPSMEEILASIRRIIADDQVTATRPIPKPPIKAPAPFAPAPRAVIETDWDLPVEALRGAVAAKPTTPEPYQETVAAEPAPKPEPPHSYWEDIPAEPVEKPEPVHPYREMPAAEPELLKTPRPEVKLEPEPVAVIGADDFLASLREKRLERPRPAAEGPEGVDSLVSAATDAAVSASLNALAVNRFLNDNMEDLVRDMLRPMLKAWLDDNLPILVERLVRAEIERVARGGR